MTVTTRIAEDLYAILEDRLKANGMTQAEFFRPLVERELREKPAVQIDYTAALFDVMVETVSAVLERHPVVPPEAFEAIVNKFVPQYFQYE